MTPPDLPGGDGLSAARRNGEQSRARYPDSEGFIERDGVRIFYEVYGDRDPTILFLPTWEISHSRAWKFQIPYFARRSCVITFDRRGSGRSEHPEDVAAYDRRATTDDALAILDKLGVDKVFVVSWCSAGEELLLAVEHPERISGLVIIAPDLQLSEGPGDELGPEAFDQEPVSAEGWGKWNRQYWLRDWRGFLEFFFAQVFTEPHSTKQIEDAVGWGLEVDPVNIVKGMDAEWFNDEDQALKLCAQITCPTMILQGSEDAIVGSARGAAVSQAIPGSHLITFEGSGHGPHLRDPVSANLVIESFVVPAAQQLIGSRRRSRPRRALYVSSPIGLGHALRDVAIADEVRKLHPDLQIDWLAQHPVTEVLARRGERIHPASAFLAGESAHMESESAEHDLHCFQAWRRMDEILVANFMVFHDVVRDDSYDLWIGDEAWEIDYYLHENPNLKTAAYVWLTDFVGWLPMPDGGDREVALTADYNTEMIEHIARYPRVRDRAIFVGEPDDVIAKPFGPGLPDIRSWTEDHFDFPGYVTGFDPADFADRPSLRAEVGYAPDEVVCIVSVGGSGVGAHLLRRVIAAYPAARRLVPALRMIVVTGPRIDPASLGGHRGVEIRPYVDNLYRHLAACDIAVVQGGLTTAMELTTNQRPYLYFPLGHHFEQNLHVRHRLERHRAGRAMDFTTDGPDQIAAAIADELRRPHDYRPVDPHGAQRAASIIAELL